MSRGVHSYRDVPASKNKTIIPSNQVMEIHQSKQQISREQGVGCKCEAEAGPVAGACKKAGSVAGECKRAGFGWR